MRAGRLRHRMTIEESLSGVWGQDETWSTFATVWGEFKPLRGNELYTAQQINSEITTRCVIRYLSGVKPQMRIVLGTRIFEILYVIDVEEKHIEMQIMAKEIV